MKSVRFCLPEDHDSGFSLIEMIVALLIAGVVFGALATTLVASVQASLFGRQNQQAADLMTRAVEEMRNIEFGALSIDASALSGDPRVVVCSGLPCLSVDGTDERLITAVVPGVAAHTAVSATETNNTQFNLSRYVTELTKATDPGVDLARRVTVYVTWSSRGELHTRFISSIISYSQRGLPLPVFKLEPPLSVTTIAPGARATHTFTLTNQGAPDHWNLELSGSTAGFALYADSNGSGSYENGADHLLGDTTGEGVPDTGLVDPSTTVRFFLVRDTAPSTPLGSLNTFVRAVSDGQPTAVGAERTVRATTVISGVAVTPTPVPSPTWTTPGPTPSPSGTPPVEVTCPAPAVTVKEPSYTPKQFALHNAGVADSALQAQLYMTTADSSRASLGMYSTNVAPTATGRVVQPSAATIDSATALGLTDSARYADWGVQFGSGAEVRGKSVVRLWAGPFPSPLPTTVKVFLYRASGVGATLSRTGLKEATVTVPACSGFQEFYVNLPDVAQTNIGANGWLGVRLVVTSGQAVRLAYDVPSTFGAYFEISGKKW